MKNVQVDRKTVITKKVKATPTVQMIPLEVVSDINGIFEKKVFKKPDIIPAAGIRFRPAKHDRKTGEYGKFLYMCYRCGGSCNRPKWALNNKLGSTCRCSESGTNAISRRFTIRGSNNDRRKQSLCHL